MIKRIINLIVWVFCFLLVVVYSWVFPAICVFALFRYVITGYEPFDYIFIPLEWIFTLPDKIKL